MDARLGATARGLSQRPNLPRTTPTADRRSPLVSWRHPSLASKTSDVSSAGADSGGDVGDPSSVGGGGGGGGGDREVRANVGNTSHSTGIAALSFL